MPSLADGANPPGMIGELAWRVISENLQKVLLVDDSDLVPEVKFFAEEMKMMVEPTACLGLAAVRKCGIDLSGKRIGLVLTGGNMDLDKYAALLAE